MRTFLLVCILPVAFGIVSNSGGGFGGGYILSRRQTIVSKRQTMGNGQIYKMIKATLERARQGISVEDLAEAADEMGEAVATIIDAHGGKVSAQEVYDIIEEIASGSDAGTALSALFDDALTYEGNLMDSALNLWNRLADREEELEEDGKSSDPVLAAISMTAQSIQDIVKNSVRIVNDSSDDEEDKNRQKRWEFTGSVNRGPHGGTSYSASVSHQWGRRSIRATMDKRQNWQGSLGAKSNGLGGAAVTGRVTHSSGNWKAGGSITHDTHRGTSYGGRVSYNNGGFSAGASVNRGSSGGTSVGVGLSYSWGRR